jgi:hypothetical protein
MQRKFYKWALTASEVYVTAVTPNMVLIEAAGGPGAFTLEATADPELRVNGVNILASATDDEILGLTMIADSVLSGQPVMGYRARVQPGEIPL